MKAIRSIAALLVVAASLFAQAPNDAAKLDANKKLLLEFFRLGSNLDARKQMLNSDYIQHNPRFLKLDEVTHLKGGEAWSAAIRTAQNHARLTDPDFNLRSAPVAVIAEGDYVVAIFKATMPDPDDPSKTYEAFNFEMVRVQDGKLAEHWDALKLAKGWMTELEKPATAK
jgi:predicted SnoaL-like aldol condensation-catalyzing enzyme